MRTANYLPWSRYACRAWLQKKCMCESYRYREVRHTEDRRIFFIYIVFVRFLLTNGNGTLLYNSQQNGAKLTGTVTVCTNACKAMWSWSGLECVCEVCGNQNTRNLNKSVGSNFLCRASRMKPLAMWRWRSRSYATALSPSQPSGSASSMPKSILSFTKPTNHSLHASWLVLLIPG